MTWRQILNGCLSCHLTWLHVHDVSTILLYGLVPYSSDGLAHGISD